MIWGEKEHGLGVGTLAQVRALDCFSRSVRHHLGEAVCFAVFGWVDAASCDDPEQNCEGCCAKRRAYLHHGQSKIHSRIGDEDTAELRLLGTKLCPTK